MPLSCDCYPGCWGAHSANWPSIKFEDKRVLAEVRAKVQAHPDFRYGSIVSMENELRFEESHLKEIAVSMVNETLEKT